MKNKIFTVMISVVFVNLFLILLKPSDTIIDFVPLLGTVSSRQISLDAYDCLIFVIIGVFYVMYSAFGINVSGFRALPHSFYPVPLMQVAFSVVAGVMTHFRLWPLLEQIIAGPVDVIKTSPNPVRRAALVSLPLSLTLIIMILNNIGKGFSSLRPRTKVMPSPP